jgi:hypothetical protein
VDAVNKKYLKSRKETVETLVHLAVDMNKVWHLNSGFGGLVVSMLASGTQVREAVGFLGRQNPQHAFLRRGSKAICPMSQLCGMLKNPTITVEVAIVG